MWCISGFVRVLHSASRRSETESYYILHPGEECMQPPADLDGQQTHRRHPLLSLTPLDGRRSFHLRVQDAYRGEDPETERMVRSERRGKKHRPRRYSFEIFLNGPCGKKKFSKLVDTTITKTWVLFSSKKFWKIDIVALSFVFDKYCPIID